MPRSPTCAARATASSICRRAMAELYERLGVRTLLCEGGPHLNAQLLAHGLVDELFLTLSPKLAGGDAMSETLRIVSGPEFDPPLDAGAGGRARARLLPVPALPGVVLAGMTAAPGQHRDAEHHAVGHHDRALVGGEGRVEQAKRADRAIDLPASGPPCRRTLSPTRNGLALRSTVPANMLPSVCWAARPRITAVKAPPSASVRGSMPMMPSATITASATVARRITKPTVPADAGSIRRNSAGPNARPTSRAIAQPSITRTITVTKSTGVSSQASCPLPCASSRAGRGGFRRAPPRR